MRALDRRLGLLFALFLALLSVALARAAWVQGVRGGELSADARSQQSEVVTVPARRGRVLDRSGKVLALSEDAASIFATPYQVKNPKAAAAKLAPILDEPGGKIAKLLSDRDSGFTYLARRVGIDEAERIDKLDITGISQLPDSRRVYPQGDLAAQVIGAVGVDNDGLTGLEQSREDTLRGEDGKWEIVRDALGQPIRYEAISEQTAGQDLRLTIDAELQQGTEEALAEVAQAYDATGATAVVVDPNTADVLAMANWPPFDPEDLADADPEELRNRATGFTYEPGSTFKAITVAAALEEHTVTPSTSFYLPPEIKVADRKIGEAEERAPVTYTVSEIITHSSNVGAVKIGLALGSEAFDRWIRNFGFGETTGTTFPGEETGIVPSLADYSGSTMGNLPIGQGVAVTPIQMARAYSAIANGGILRRVRLVSEVDGRPIEVDDGRRVISARTSRQMREMLKGVLAPGGTASQISVPGYELAGKTGTSEKAEDGGYSKTDFVASFVGFAPADKPEVLIAVVVDEPEGDETAGGVVAAPAFAKIASFALPYLGVSPQ